MHRTSIGTKNDVSLGNIFMAEIEMQILDKSTYKQLYGNATSTM